jgi:hypothetical protein
VSRRDVGRRLALGVATSALCLVAVDLAFRAYERHNWIHVLPDETELYDLTALRYNDHEGTLPRSRPADEFRILAFGDSFLESATLPAWTYAKRLQDRLAATSGRPVRVVNFGRNGTSFDDYRFQMDFWGERIDFDAVLIGVYVGNDWLESTDMLWVAADEQSAPIVEDAVARSYGPGVDIPRRFPLRFLDYLFARLYGGLYEAGTMPEGERYHERSLQYPDDVYLEALSRHAAYYDSETMLAAAGGHAWLFRLLRAAADLERAGKPVLVHVAPSHVAVDDDWQRRVRAERDRPTSEFDPSLPAALVAEIAREAGLVAEIVDLTGCLRAAAALGQAPYWGTNTHWSVRGNEIVAELLARVLLPPWLGVEVGVGDPLLADCETTPRDVRPEERDAVLTSVSLGVDADALETGALAGLRGVRFANEAALFEALEARGLEPNDGRIVGAFWGQPGEKRIQLQRPHGLRHFVRPRGFATDDAVPGRSLLIAFFLRGELIGVGRTHRPLGDEASLVDGVPSDRPNVAFASLIAQPSPAPRGPDDLWVLAVSPSGRFARLPADPKGPHGVSLPWARQ